MITLCYTFHFAFICTSCYWCCTWSIICISKSCNNSCCITISCNVTSVNTVFYNTIFSLSNNTTNYICLRGSNISIIFTFIKNTILCLAYQSCHYLRIIVVYNVCIIYTMYKFTRICFPYHSWTITVYFNPITCNTTVCKFWINSRICKVDAQTSAIFFFFTFDFKILYFTYVNIIK